MRLSSFCSLVMWLVLVQWSPVPLFAESSTPDATIGISGRCWLKSSYSDLVPIPPEKSGQPLIVRVIERVPVSDGYRYHLEYLAFQEGTYSLRKSLIPPATDGQKEDDPSENRDSSITIGALTPVDQMEIVASPVHLPRLSWRWELWVLTAGIVWLLAGMVLWRKRVTSPEVFSEPLLVQNESALDLLQKDLERAAQVPLTPLESAELERRIFSFWQNELGLQPLPITQVWKELMQHPAAGEMLRVLSELLHAPAEDKGHISAPSTSWQTIRNCLSDRTSVIPQEENR